MPTYLKNKYIFFLHFDLRSDPDFVSSKCLILIPEMNPTLLEKGNQTPLFIAKLKEFKLISFR